MAFKLRSGFLKAGDFKQMGSSPIKRTYAEAKAADPKLDSYIKQRNDYAPGTNKYEELQAKINKAYGKTRDKKAEMRDAAKLPVLPMEGKKATQIKQEDTDKKDLATKTGQKPASTTKGAGAVGTTAKAAAAGAAVAAGAQAAKSAGKAAQDLEKHVKVSDDGKTVTEQYTKTSAKDAPGKGGDFDRPGDKPEPTPTVELTKKEQKKADKRDKQKKKDDEKTAKYMDSKAKIRFDRNVEAEKMAEQSGGKITKGQAKRSLKQQEKDEAALAAKEAADKAERERLGGGFVKPKDTKSTMTKKASPNKIYNKPKGKRTKY